MYCKGCKKILKYFMGAGIKKVGNHCFNGIILLKNQLVHACGTVTCVRTGIELNCLIYVFKIYV